MYDDNDEISSISDTLERRYTHRQIPSAVLIPDNECSDGTLRNNDTDACLPPCFLRASPKKKAAIVIFTAMLFGCLFFFVVWVGLLASSSSKGGGQSSSSSSSAVSPNSQDNIPSTSNSQEDVSTIISNGPQISLRENTFDNTDQAAAEEAAEQPEQPLLDFIDILSVPTAAPDTESIPITIKDGAPDFDLPVLPDDDDIDTLSPSQVPTPSPSLQPTSTPPTFLPTSSHPSLSPTVYPTNSPTRKPTTHPSTQPTNESSSGAPTTKEPTTSTTITPNPTNTSPSSAPSRLPSNKPTTLSPSPQPTIIPTTTTPSTTAPTTTTPSAMPTTMFPTSEPSTLPTTTALPSQLPTIAKSSAPTASPSTISPTKAPSYIPTMLPSLLPTALSSLSPTISPSIRPSHVPSEEPTVSPLEIPTEEPSTSPSVTLSNTPTVLPSKSPTALPSQSPSVSPSKTPTALPSTTPSISPSKSPTVSPSTSPTASPSTTPTISPSKTPTALPSKSPTVSPSTTPTVSPTASPITSPPPPTTTTTPKVAFYIMSGDDEYTGSLLDLERGLGNLPNSNKEWLVHLGDISSGSSNCDVSEYINFVSTYSHSSVPVYCLPGDNEWKRCPDPNQAWSYWNQYLGSSFTTRFFDKPKGYTVQRQEDRTENFAFVRRGIQYIGINIVAGPIDDEIEWTNRHAANLQWIKNNVDANFDDIYGVIIFGHAGPCCIDESSPLNILDTQFFEPLAQEASTWQKTTIFMQETNKKFEWSLTKNIENVSNFWIVKVQSGVWPPMRVEVDRASKAISFDQNGLSATAFMN